MNTIAKLTLASTLLLSTTIGVAQAQQATGTPVPPVGAEQMDGRQADGDCGRENWGQDDRRHGRRYGKHYDEGRDRGGPTRLIDANADGIINDDEAASLADHAFNRMDQNGDASLNETEFTTFQGGRGHRGGWFNWGNSDEAAAVLKVRKDKFVALDTDKTAGISKAEFFAEAKAKLASADTDKDGKVSPWEFRAQN